MYCEKRQPISVLDNCCVVRRLRRLPVAKWVLLLYYLLIEVKIQVFDRTHIHHTLRGFSYIWRASANNFDMRTLIIILSLGTASLCAQNISPDKAAIITSVDDRAADLIDLSDQIWALAETAFEESKSSALLADYAESNGFKIERGVGDMPTAFIATYGSGAPVIGILGEFDALPGLSQTATPTR